MLAQRNKIILSNLEFGKPSSVHILDSLTSLQLQPFSSTYKNLLCFMSNKSNNKRINAKLESIQVENSCFSRKVVTILFGVAILELKCLTCRSWKTQLNSIVSELSYCIIYLMLPLMRMGTMPRESLWVWVCVCELSFAVQRVYFDYTLREDEASLHTLSID